jgi:dipeptide transport system permease protein
MADLFVVADEASAYPSPAKSFWLSFSANKGAVVALLVFTLILLCAIGAPWLAPYDPAAQFRDHLLAPPSWQEGGSHTYWLGTDELGRDLLSRAIFGARISLSIAFLSVVMSMLPGIALGLVAAFFPRVLGAIIMRLIDIMMALPSLLLAVCIVAILGPGLFNTMLAIAIGTLPNCARITRASALAELPRDYVTASRVAGAGTLRLMFVTVLPNCLAPIIVTASLGFSTAILETAALGFLGLGVSPPAPEWGTMLSSARDYLTLAPWVINVPGAAILLTVIAVNLMGDAVRDALDPKLKRVS